MVTNADEAGVSLSTREPDGEDACGLLLDRVQSTEDPAWQELVELLWPRLTRVVRHNRAMAVLSRSEDHVRNAVLLTVEKLGRDECRGARLHRPWRAAHPDKTLEDWLVTVTTNVIRDYVRQRTGVRSRRARRADVSRAEAQPVDKRLLVSLATLLPDDDQLRPSAQLSATSNLAARELARWAEDRLPADQRAALQAWLEGASFGEMVAELKVADEPTARRLVRAAMATLRRHAKAA
jgi:hypothetical protein